MTVRRHAARLATVCGLLGGLVVLGAVPALADEDSVRVGAASSFAAGGSAQGVNIAVRKRTDGCVVLRTAVGLRLNGLRADQVTVQVALGGHWVPVSVSGGDGNVATAWTSSSKPLCKGKGTTARYKVAIAAGAPNGQLVVLGEAASATGQVLGRATDTSKVTGGMVSPSPTPKTTKKPTPSPSAVVTEATTADEALPAALGGTSAAPTAAAAEESSGGSPVMYFGIAMVTVGLLLIGLLLRRSRQDRTPADETLPGNPGGTTYRSGGGSPVAPANSGPVYGQQPPAGGYGGVPSPRPASGGVYGARPSSPGSTPDATQALPGAPLLPGADVTRPLPGADVTRPLPGDQPPPAQGGEHTVFMPRLPG